MHLEFLLTRVEHILTVSVTAFVWAELRDPGLASADPESLFDAVEWWGSEQWYDTFVLVNQEVPGYECHTEEGRLKSTDNGVSGIC